MSESMSKAERLGEAVGSSIGIVFKIARDVLIVLACAQYLWGF